jgi:hypothetical protein
VVALLCDCCWIARGLGKRICTSCLMYFIFYILCTSSGKVMARGDRRRNTTVVQVARRCLPHEHFTGQKFCNHLKYSLWTTSCGEVVAAAYRSIQVDVLKTSPRNDRYRCDIRPIMSGHRERMTDTDNIAPLESTLSIRTHACMIFEIHPLLWDFRFLRRRVWSLESSMM